MNETMQTILTRRSTRKFKVQEIPQTDLDQILKAALYAPSGMGKQTWQFTVVKNRKKVQRLAEAAGKILGRENYDMYQPEILIIPSLLASSAASDVYKRQDWLCVDQSASGNLR